MLNINFDLIVKNKQHLQKNFLIRGLEVYRSFWDKDRKQARVELGQAQPPQLNWA